MSDQTRYVQQMLPWARRAAADTGLPVSVILAQWALETGWGRSYLATRHHSHAGIKYFPPHSIARGRAAVAGFHRAFASYQDLQQFLADYRRVMMLRHYVEVRQVAAASHPSARARAEAVALALGRSPWDAARYTRAGVQGQKLVDILVQHRLWEHDEAVASAAPRVAPPGGVTLPVVDVVEAGPGRVVVSTPEEGWAAAMLLGVAAAAVLAGLAVIRPAGGDSE